MKKVMFVDDEAQILKAIKRIFIDSGFKLYCAQSAEAALGILRSDSVDMIVTDIRMPGMDGLELLQIVRQEYPETVRVVLSGYTDDNEVMQTLQSNLAKAYLFKPWNNDELISIVEENLQNACVNLPADLVSYINNLNSLPTIRNRYRNTLNALQDGKDFAAISSEIEKDQTVVAKILQIINSAFYGVKTASVKKALACIGMGELEELVRSMEIMDYIQVPGTNSCAAEIMWNHAYCTSKIQKIIHQCLPRERSRFDATAGLLHKIGAALMMKYHGSPYISMVQLALLGKAPDLLGWERAQYGYNHAELSAYLLRWWNAPSEMADAAAFYANPFDENLVNKELACIVHIAQHYACRAYGIGPFCDFLPETFEFSKIDRSTFEELFQKEHFD